jgi:hypothetical protein
MFFVKLLSDPLCLTKHVNHAMAILEGFLAACMNSDRIEEICPVLLIVEKIVCSGNYRVRVILRDDLSRRFLQLSFEQEIAVSVLYRIIEMSIWFFSDLTARQTSRVSRLSHSCGRHRADSILSQSAALGKPLVRDYTGSTRS